MAQKTTQTAPGRTQGLTDEHRACAAWVLGTIADTYAAESPAAPVDLLDFPVRVGATAYNLVGESCHGGAPAISRAARAEAGHVEEDLTRGELSLRLRRAARRLGCEWDDNGPVVPRIPGPRKPTGAGVSV
ncbi:hypothetical protein ACKI16_29640 [Streptomyces scabiei]|uniref:hypothetical protein n=1 Tax=Streptomyces scabiei TaxID=1930 RepID=UPI0038F6F026